MHNFLEGREKILDIFESKRFSIKPKGAGILNPNHSKFKILSPKQMLQRLPIALAQVKAGKNSENLLNEIRKIVYSLYQSKKFTKKVYNNIIKSIQQSTYAHIKDGYYISIFMNSENSKNSDPHVLILTNKLDLRIGEEVITFSNLRIYYTWKNIKSSYNNNKFKRSAPTWNDEF